MQLIYKDKTLVNRVLRIYKKEDEIYWCIWILDSSKKTWQ